MNVGDNDNHLPLARDRVAALELVRRLVQGQDPILKVDGTLGYDFAARLDQVGRALEAYGLAEIRRTADGRPSGGPLTEYGAFVGERLADGYRALVPARGGLKLVRAPRRTPDRSIDGWTTALILASAPAHYGEDVVEGAATHVILDRLRSWKTHPAFRLRRRDPGPVLRAWEVFCEDGSSFGLVLQTPDGFAGLDAHAGQSLEGSLGEAAWQVRVNC